MRTDQIAAWERKKLEVRNKLKAEIDAFARSGDYCYIHDQDNSIERICEACVIDAVVKFYAKQEAPHE